MNAAHRRLCSSEKWALGVRERLLPWALKDVDLGADVLEIGPGYGATTRVLAEQVPALTALEYDETTARDLDREFGEKVRVLQGDGADMPLPDDGFSGVSCFTMLHHVPSPQLQDRLFVEACRVLKPGGVFAGSDSQPNWRFRLLHIGDTMVVVDPKTLPDRLRAAGFVDPEVHLHEVTGGLKFTARKPSSG